MTTSLMPAAAIWSSAWRNAAILSLNTRVEATVSAKVRNAPLPSPRGSNSGSWTCGSAIMATSIGSVGRQILFDPPDPGRRPAGRGNQHGLGRLEPFIRPQLSAAAHMVECHVERGEHLRH